jgi:hypothetical protein
MDSGACDVIDIHQHTAFTEESRPSWTDGGDPALWTDPAKFELQPVSDEDLKSGHTPIIDMRGSRG